MGRFRKPSRLIEILALGLIATACVTYKVLAELPPAESRADLLEEIETMSRVIGDSLEEAFAEEHEFGRGRRLRVRSGIGGSVTGEYIPSVGAIFTIPVGFPLIEREEAEPAADADEAGEEDLWERNLRRARGRRSGGGFGGRDIGRDLDLEFSFEDLDVELNEAMAGLEIDLASIGHEIEVNLAVAMQGLEAGLAELEVELAREMENVEIELERVSEELDHELPEALEEAREEVERAHEEGEIDDEEYEEAIEGLHTADVAIRRVVPRIARIVPPIVTQIVPNVVGPILRSIQAPFRMHAQAGPRGRVLMFGAAVEYDEERVNKLRETLIETLAEYGHRLGNLPASEKVILIVEGPGQGSGRSASVIIRRDEDGGRRIERRERIQIRRGAGGILRFGGGDFTGRAGRAAPDRYVISAAKSALEKGTTAEALERRIEETRY